MVNVTANDFQNEVLENNKAVLVDFWAPWCGPCRMVSPILEQIAQEQGDKVKIVKVNVDENPQLAQKYGIMSIPTMMIFKEGKIVEKFVGAMPKAQIEGKLGKWMH